MKQSLLLIVSLMMTVAYGSIDHNEECENEEKQVEICARDFLFYRNETMPQTGPEMDKFCRENKSKETCLGTHSKKCLAHSANQAIIELLRSMSKQNRAICANKNGRRLYTKLAHCMNKKGTSGLCYERFREQIHGIHQYSQDEKIPVICW